MEVFIPNIRSAWHPAALALPLQSVLRFNRRFSVSHSAALLTALIGVVVLVGWMLDLPLLRSVIPGAVEMKANTALNLVLTGTALYLLSSQPTRSSRRAAQILAAAAALLGFATFCEYVLGQSFGIDEMLFSDTGTAYNAIRGRMSPYSALAFACIGAALATLPHSSVRPLTWVGLISVTLIGIVSFVGYLWNAAELVTDRWLPPVAIHTAIAFILLGIGTQAATSKWITTPSDRPARLSTTEFKLLMGFGISLLLLLLGGGLTYRATQQVSDTAQTIEQTQEVRRSLRRLYGTVSDAESATRHYLLTGLRSSRDDFHRLALEVTANEKNLANLVADNSAGLHDMTPLHKLIAIRMGRLETVIGLYEQQGLAAVMSIATSAGPRAMRDLLVLVNQIDEAEARLLAKRQAAMTGARQIVLLALLLTFLILVAVFIAQFQIIRRETAAREKSDLKRRLAEHRISVAKDEAVSANIAKDAFLATMSHELRTPLNGLLGMLELLGFSRLDEEQRETLEAARDSGRGMVRIIDDVLDHAKIAAGKLEIVAEPLSMNHVLKRVVNNFQAVASAKGLTLAYAVDSRLSPALLGDPLRLIQILGNLVSNAIKFTREGSIDIRADWLERKDGIELVRLSVADSGIGIDLEAQKRLFQPYEQAASDTSRLYGGTGLGLAICRRLTEMMGGTIAIESAPDQGTTFIVILRLPVSETLPATLPAEITALNLVRKLRSGARPETAADAPLVLAVDDNSTNRRLLSRQLSLLGLRVETASDGHEALAHWRSGKFDLLITDCNMPGMDGYVLAQTIREIEGQEHREPIRIIAWTANVLNGAVAKCTAAGMDDMLIKPAELTQLKAVLCRWLEVGESAHAVVEGSALTTLPVPAETAAQPLNINCLKALAGDDPEVIAELLQDFWSSAVVIAADLRAACQSENAAAASAAGHKLKSSARSVGALALGELSDQIEQAGAGGEFAALAMLLPRFEDELARVNVYLAGRNLSATVVT